MTARHCLHSATRLRRRWPFLGPGGVPPTIGAAGGRIRPASTGPLPGGGRIPQGNATMKTVILGAVLLLGTATAPLLAQTAPARNSPPGTLMSCQVQEVRGSGENTEVVYNMNCMPVVGGDVARVEQQQNGEYRVTYGAGRPAYGGGPVYILRFISELGQVGEGYHGAPLDGNPGTARR